MDLKGKIIIVTGASSGIGEATALQLSQAGATVVLVARRQDRLAKLADEIKQHGGNALVVEADLQDESSPSFIIKTVVDTYGRIDVLVNNAGVMLLGPVRDAPLEEWTNMINLNVLSLMRMTHAALPYLEKAEVGHIVNISSVAGRIATANSAVYNASKWAVNAFTEALRQEIVVAKHHIRTTLIEPGSVATELVSHNRPEIQEVLKKRYQGIEKRLESEDIARAIVYAVSQPSHVNINEILIRPSTQAM